MKILVTSNSFGKQNSEVFDQLQEAGIKVIRNNTGRMMTEAELMEQTAEVDGIILGTEEFGRKIIENAKKLKVVSRYGVGIDNVDVQCLKEKGIELRITKNANSDAVADHTLGLMLAVAHNLAKADRSCRAEKWSKSTSLDLYEKTVGIIGFGSIGKKVSERVKGFRCQVIAFDKYFDEDYIRENKIIKADIDSILSQADFISLHLPSVPEYAGFLNQESFAKMKKTAIVINTARADLIDHPALYQALKDGVIAGYGCDVFAEEPKIDKTLITFDNVVMTPHMAAVTIGAINEMSRMATENILDVLEKSQHE